MEWYVKGNEYNTWVSTLLDYTQKVYNAFQIIIQLVRRMRYLLGIVYPFKERTRWEILSSHMKSGAMSPLLPLDIQFVNACFNVLR
jgi:hypothetical protein